MDWFTSFTTGSNDDGYTLTGVDLVLPDGATLTTTFEVQIYSTTASPRRPDSKLGTLTHPASLVSGTNTFTAPGAGIDLAASTTYGVLFDVTSAGGGTVGTTNSNAEDSGTAPGWSIGDTGLHRTRNRSDTWSTDSGSLRFAIRGHAKSGDTAPNSAPVFTNQPTTASVAENSADGTAVATVAATDADGDTITYSLDTAADKVFDISAGGAITVQVETGSALDHEATSSYTVTVTATDANSATATHNITISVSDVAEPPAAPAAPTVTGASTSSLTVRWTAPANTGPAVFDYNVRYKLSTATTWKNHNFVSAATLTTILSLDPGTYDVQVKAQNAEGQSPWSDSGSGTTHSTITIAAGTSPVTEGTAATFTLTASPTPSADLVVNLTVADAAGSSDFVAASDEGSKTVTIAADNATATYSISTVADSTDEPNGNVTVTVNAGTGYALAATTAASVTVEDDDVLVPTLVSNTGQADGGDATLNNDHAQSFTTGKRADGYTLNQVRLEFEVTSGTAPTYTVKIHADSNGEPGAEVSGGELTQVGSLPSTAGLVEFRVADPGGLELAAKTRYWVVVDVTSNPSATTTLGRTTGKGEDSGGATGWTIADDRRWRLSATTDWQSEGSNVLKVSVHGTENPDTMPPAFESAKVDGTTLTVTFDEALDTSSVPVGSVFTVSGDLSGDLSGTGTMTISDATATVTLSSAPETGEALTVSYTASKTNPLRDALGHQVATFTGAAVTNETGFVTLVSNTGQAQGSSHDDSRNWAQAFTTGSGGGGYKLTSVGVRFIVQNQSHTNWDVELWSNSGTSPGAKLATLDKPALVSTGVNKFTADGTGIDLDADTTYWVVWSNRSNGGDSMFIKTTTSDAEDPGSADGWSIHDSSQFRNNNMWNVQVQSGMISVDGYAKPDETPPAFESAAVDGTTLKIVFSENLAATSVPAPGAFDVQVNGSRRNVATSGVAIADDTVTLTLSSAVVVGATVTVAYTKPTSNPLQDLVGNAVETFAAETVDDARTRVTALVVSSTAGADNSYAIGDTISLQATFSEAVTVTTAGGNPRIPFALGAETEYATYHSGSTTTTLEFRYTVAEGDLDSDGISVAANALELNGGTINDSSGNAARLAHAAVAASANHKVDGVRPTVTRATVKRDKITLTWAETLRTSTPPVDADFAVTVAGSAAPLAASNSVSISGRVLTLTLASPVSPDAAVVRVAYTADAARPIADLPGNEAASPVTWTVTNDPSPTFDDGASATFTIAENSPPGAEVGTLAVTSGDVELAFSLSSAGTDHESFAIDNAGRITVASGATLDFETKSSYSIVASVTDGTDTDGNPQTPGSETPDDTIDVTITLTDVALPGAPRPVPFRDKSSNLVIGDALDGAIRLRWQRPTGSTPVTGYRIHWWQKDNYATTAMHVDVAAVAIGNDHQDYTITGLTNGVTYGAAYSSINSEGHSPLTLPSTFDSSFVTPTAETGLDVNRTPGSLSVSSDTAGQLRVQWAAPGNTSNVLKYKVAWSSSTSFIGATSAEVGANGRSHTITGLTGGQAYVVRISTVYKHTSGGEGQFEAHAFISGTALSGPSSVTDLAVEVDDGQLHLSWEPPASDGGLPIARYEVQWSESGSSTTNEANVGLAKSYTVTGLTNEQAYDIKVRAVNAGTDPNPGGNSAARTFDGAFATVTATPNSPPTSADVIKDTSLDSEYMFAAADFPFTDVSPGDKLTAVTVVTLPDPTHGTLNYGNPRKAVSVGDRFVPGDLDALIFAPTSGYSGTASFMFRVEDSHGAESGANTVYVRVADTPAGTYVLGVSLVSNPGADRTYAIGDTIQLRGTFNQNVTVSTTAGTPRIEFTLGAATKYAEYVSGTGTQSLVFSYTVAAGDADSDGIAVAANKLQLNGGTIGDGSLNAVTLTHAAVAADNGHQVDGVAPSVMGAPAFVSAPAAGDTYRLGEHLDVALSFTEPVVVNGAPQLAVLVGNQTRQATYHAGSGTAELTFRYTLVVGDVDTDGVSIANGTLALNSGTIADVPGNAATLAYSALAAQSDHKVNAARDAAPTGATANGRWLTLTFNKSVSAVLDSSNEDPGAGDLGTAWQRLGWAFRVSGAYKDGVRLRNLHPRVWSVSGKTVTLRQGDTAFLPGSSGISVIYDEDIAASAGAVLRDSDGNNVPGFSLTDAQVTNNTPGSARPLLTAAQVAGTELTLRFDTELDTASTPAGDRFKVTVHPRGWNAESRFVSGTGTATVRDSTVTVTLGSPVEQDATVRVAYDKPDANTLRATTGTTQAEVDDIWWAPVSVMDRTAPKLHSVFATDSVVWVNYDEKLDTTSAPATSDFTVVKGTTTATLSGIMLAEDGVGVSFSAPGSTGAVKVSYSPGTNPIRDVAGNDAAAFSAQTATDENITGVPTLTGAETDGDLVTLKFNRPLKGTNVPAVSAFKVQDLLAAQISGFDWAQTIRSVSVRGTTVVLDVSPGIFACAAARVSYTQPDEGALTNLGTGKVVSFSDQSITNLHASRCVFDPVRIASMDGTEGASGNAGRKMSVQFDRRLRSSSVPSSDSLTVTSGPGGDAGPIEVDDVQLLDDVTRLLLTLSLAPSEGEQLTLSYQPPRSNPGLIDSDGNQIAPFSAAVEIPEPANRAPVFRGAAPGWNNAPPGTLVSLVASQDDFVDPDGDPLTFELTASRGDVHTPGLLTYSEQHGRIFFAAKNACGLASVDPLLPLVFDTVVTMTATDPDGAAASTTATFRTDRTGYVCASLTEASVDGATVTLDFDAAFAKGVVLDADSMLRLHTVPAASEFVVTADGEEILLAAADAVTAEGTTITLTLASPVTSDHTVAVSYVPGDSPVAFAFAGQLATNETPPPPEPPEPEEPACDAAPGDGDATMPTCAAVAGNVLTLTFNRDLRAINDATARTLRWYFLIEGAFHHGTPITQSPSSVAVDGNTVTLTLGTAVQPGNDVTVSYFDDTLHDTNGTPIANFATTLITTAKN